MSRLLWMTLLLLLFYALMFVRMTYRMESTPRYPPGHRAVASAAPRHRPPETPLPSESVVESPRPARVFHGRVTDADGHPLVDVEVTIGGDTTRLVTLTDEGGEFRLSLASLRAQLDHEVRFRKLGWASRRSTLWTLSSAAEVRLQPSGHMRGRILDPDSLPVGDVRIVAHGSDNWWTETTSDANGLFEIDPPAGSVVVTAHSHRYADSHVRGIEIAPGEHAEVVMELSRGVALRTRFIDERDQPVPGVRVTVRTAAGDLEQAVTGDGGQALFQGLAADVATLVATHPGNAELVERFAILAGTGEELRTFGLEPATPWSLEMSLPDHLDPKAVTLAIARSGQVLYQGPAGARGATQILGRGRDYLFTFRADGCPLVRRHWSPPAEGNGVLAVALARGGRVRGMVLDPLGRPVGDATVVFHPLTERTRVQMSPHSRQTRTNGSGRFQSALLVGGQYRVEIEQPDGAGLWRNAGVADGEGIDLGILVIGGGAPLPEDSAPEERGDQVDQQPVE